jgi:hypothetical protein
MYINDRNSSTIREFLTVTIAGYSHSNTKIGFNGYRHNSVGKAIFCEAKPKNFNTKDYEDYKNGLRKGSPSKLNGGGNFTDYTHNRLVKDIAENPNMLISGFVDGQLMFIFEFPFNTPSFVERLKKQLDKMFPRGDIEGSYLRGANFTFKDYQNDNFKVIFITTKEVLKNNKPYFSNDIYNFLINYA